MRRSSLLTMPVFVAACLSCIGTGRSIAAPPPAGAVPAGETAKRILEAHERKDDDAIRAVAKERPADPWYVANVLFGHAIGAYDGASAKPEAFLAARVFAAAAATRPEAEGLPALVDRWAGLSSDDVAREKRLRQLYAELLAPREAPAEGAPLFDAAKADWDAAPWSLTSIALTQPAGRSLVYAQRLPQDEEILSAAADRAQALGWGLGAAEQWSAVAARASARDDYAKALSFQSKSLEMFQAMGDKRRTAIMRGNRALVLVEAGRPQEALAESERARSAADAADAKDAHAQADSAAGRAARALGRDAEADAYLAKAADQFRAIGLVDRANAELGDWVRQLIDVGNFAQVLDVAERVLGIVGTGARPATLFGIHGNLAVAYLRLGRHDRALDEARKAFVAAEATKYQPNVVRAHFVLVASLAALGRQAEVDAELASVEEAATKLGNLNLRVDALMVWGGQALVAGNFSEAEAKFRAALSVAEGRSSPASIAVIETQLARSLESRGESAAAIELLDKAVTRFESVGRRLPESVAARSVRAASLLRVGRPEEAVQDLRYALEVSRALGRRLGDGDAVGLRGVARAVADLGVEAALGAPTTDAAHRATAARAAFDFIEESRGAMLAESLANARGLLAARLPPELVEADASTRAAVESAQRLALSPANSGDRGIAGSASETIESAWRKRDEALGRIERAARSIVAFATPPPPDLDAAQAALGADEALILFHLAAHRAAALVVRRDAVTLVPMGSTAEVTRAIEGWLRVASTPGSDDADAARAAYELVLRPLERPLADAKRWIIVPDRVLAFLPFDALLRVDGERRERVVERVEICCVPSAAVYAALVAELSAPSGDARLLAVGAPAVPKAAVAAAAFPELPESREEAIDAVSRVPEARRILLLGADASLARVLAAFAQPGPRFGSVHFACHGVVDSRRPRGTGLVLADGEILDADRLARTRIPADLVVLSACESGRGADVEGEGVFGLARAFFLAGVPRVIVSQWSVSDAATRPLMKHFYDAKANGSGPAAALREAKIGALKAGGTAAHPSKWAAFVLWGVPR